ncbi:hypothetical protein ROHU_000564 [Labeo rohita]|uniref:Uncharacterized protein n=1 Tax=Labeo rohita TaxID=84645 RepID=A0A498P499_LABRO|nr:hypothetical protein ROHU_000564 [Labeo rohita]
MAATPEDVDDIVRREITSRLIIKLESALSRTPLDLDFLQFACRQELYLWEALSRHVNVPPDIVQALRDFLHLVMDHIENAEVTSSTVETVAGEMGRPRYNIVLFGAVDGYSRKDIEEPDIDWDAAADYGEDVDGVIVVPEFECPLNEQQLVELQVLIEENGDTDTTDLYLLCHEYVLQALSGV